MSTRLPRIDTLDRRAREDSVPVNVLFELTHRCNLRCFHCYVVPDRRRELDTPEVKDVLRQLAEAGTLFVTFTGGEILLRPDLFEIVRYARDAHFAVRLFTNGTLVDDEVADRIASLTPVDVGVSVYGATAATHERVTGRPGSFSASTEALRLLAERGVTTRLKVVLMDFNAGEQAALAALAKRLGATIQIDPQLTPRNDGDDSAMAHTLDDESLRAVVDGAGMDGHAYADAPLCSGGRDSASISPSGLVNPCVQLPLPLGDLRSDSFAAIWSGDAARRMRSYTLSALDGCSSCRDLDRCNPCLGLNLVEAGDLAKPSASVCRMARARRKETA